MGDMGALRARHGSVNFTGLGTIATDAFGFSCATGVQFSGTVTPDDYKGLVIMKRTLVQGALYDGVSGQVGTYPSAGHPPDDTSQDGVRDDDPQSGGSKGVVYDLDAPGPVDVFPSGTTRYTRFNFSEYAVLDDKRNSVPVADAFAWFSRVACAMNQDNPRIVYLLNNAGDNQVGKGTTSITQ
jgi:hypothetical protein